MAASLERGGEKRVEDGLGSLVADEAARQHHDVGVVVLAYEAGHIGVPHQSGTHALVLVQCDGHTLATAT